MQRKKIIGAGITLFAVILGIIWLIPLIWLIGNCVFCPLLPYDPVSDYAFYTGQLKVCVECDSLRDLLPEYADSGDLYLCSAVRHFHSGGICVGRYGF